MTSSKTLSVQCPRDGQPVRVTVTYDGFAGNPYAKATAFHCPNAQFLGGCTERRCPVVKLVDP